VDKSILNENQAWNTFTTIQVSCYSIIKVLEGQVQSPGEADERSPLTLLFLCRTFLLCTITSGARIYFQIKHSNGFSVHVCYLIER